MDIPTKDRLYEALAARNMKAIDLSKATGLSRGAISQWLSGKANPKQDKIYIMSKALNVSAAWLMGKDVPMNESVTSNNISIGTNNGAVSGNGNATVIECPLTDDKLEVSLRAMLGDSVETDDIVQALTDGVTVLKDLDDFDRQNLRLYLQGIVNVIKKAKANGDKYKPRSKL